jgi:HlyD family secretion protein
MKPRTKKFGLAAGALLVLAGAVMVWAIRPTYDVDVTTENATVGSVVPTVVAVGTLQPTTVVEVGAQVSGTIQSVDADFNSLVHAGEAIARIDPSANKAQLAEAHATLAQDEAAVTGLATVLADDRVQLARAHLLLADHLMDQSDFDVAQVAADGANAALKAADAQVAEARAEAKTEETNLANTVIRSPIDGIVVTRNVDAGQTIAATVQTPVLFTIASDLTHMQLLANIDESDVGKLVPGSSATFTVDGYPGRTFSGRTSMIRLQPNVLQTGQAAQGGPPTPTAAPAGTSVVTYTAVIDVNNPGERLRPGMTATITLAGVRRDGVVRVPNSALAFRPSPQVLARAGEAASQASRHDTVWLYNGKRLTPVAVRTGLTDDRWTELVSGSISPAQPLVTGASVDRKRKL